MKKIILTDTHYGVKQNSINWFNAQKDFIYNELIPYINSIKNERIYIYHCGDVFDSRSSINPMIAKGVRQIFKDLAKLVDNIYVIAGNHDFYSPVEDDVTGIEMVLSDIENVRLITNHSYIANNDLMIPWYEFDKYETLKQDIETYKPKAIFCHTDLTMITPEHKELLKNVKVFSGHIHTPNFNGNLITLGSTYALTFADHNSERGFYVISDDYSYEFVAGKNIIKFYRFYNEDIFSIKPNDYKNDYLELYIDKLNLLNECYMDQIKKCSKAITNLTVIPLTEIQKGGTTIEFENYNIEDICRKQIPEELKDKFEQIIKQISETKL